MRLLPSGERAVLVEVADLDEVLALAGSVRNMAGVEDVVPGERTLLVTVTSALDLAAVRAALADVASHPLPAAAPARTVEIPVVYDGRDLADVAAHTGLTVTQVIDAHTATLWRVGFGGFAPGFAYLVGGDARLEVPRRAEPRPSVPGGGGPRRPLLRHLPALVAGRLAAHRPYRRGAVRRRERPARAAPAWHDRTVRCPRSSAWLSCSSSRQGP